MIKHRFQWKQTLWKIEKRTGDVSWRSVVCRRNELEAANNRLVLELENTRRNVERVEFLEKELKEAQQAWSNFRIEQEHPQEASMESGPGSFEWKFEDAQAMCEAMKEQKEAVQEEKEDNIM